MKANKRILDLCNVLQLLFLAFFAWVLLDFLRMGKGEREMIGLFQHGHAGTCNTGQFADAGTERLL